MPEQAAALGTGHAVVHQHDHGGHGQERQADEQAVGPHEGGDRGSGATCVQVVAVQVEECGPRLHDRTL